MTKGQQALQEEAGSARLRASPASVGASVSEPRMRPWAEFRPTAVTSIRPYPSSTLLPLSIMGAPPACFSTSSASPVRWLSSSLLAPTSGRLEQAALQ